MSEFWDWESLWNIFPLVLHDKDLLLEREYIALAQSRNSTISMDLTKQLSVVLNNHPSPIGYFWIDSSVWNKGGGEMGEWLRVLSAKGIHELIIVNTAMPVDIAFPISGLQSPNFAMLSLGFMDIVGLEVHGFDYTSLTSLQLTGCTYDGQALSSVIFENFDN